MAGQTSTYEDAVGVVRYLKEAGHVAYLAGGCVRDRLLNLHASDFDVATDAEPDKIKKLFRRCQSVGAAFGVMLVSSGQSVIEVATFRSDGTYDDGRRPNSVRFTTAQEDANRRDFTINALFFDPLENKIIDFVGGQKDLESKLLRAVGDARQRFEEDHLRLLRAVRFAARFGLQVEADTAKAIRACAPKLPRISPERIADELRRMLVAPTRTAALLLLRQLGLNEQVFRYLEAPPTHDQLIFQHVCPGQEVSFALALGAAVLDEQSEAGSDLRSHLKEQAASTTVRSMRKSLRLSNEETDALEFILFQTGRLLGDEELTTAAVKRILASPFSGDVLALISAIGTAGFFSQKVQSVLARCALLAQEDCQPLPLITGDDLKNLNIPPGPIYKQLLTQAYDAQLEKRINTPHEAQAWLSSYIAQHLPKVSN